MYRLFFLLLLTISFSEIQTSLIPDLRFLTQKQIIEKEKPAFLSSVIFGMNDEGCEILFPQVTISLGQEDGKSISNMGGTPAGFYMCRIQPLGLKTGQIFIPSDEHLEDFVSQMDANGLEVYDSQIKTGDKFICFSIEGRFRANRTYACMNICFSKKNMYLLTACSDESDWDEKDQFFDSFKITPMNDF